VPTPRGNVALFGQSTAHRGLPELLAAIAATPPGDAYFFYPYDAMLPFLSGREQVSKYDLFQPVYTAPAQYQEACRSAMRLGSSSTGIGKIQRGGRIPIPADFWAELKQDKLIRADAPTSA
jgi:O-acetyl-ADP-ribose deacetylase (regulator of RNase III)